MDWRVLQGKSRHLLHPYGGGGIKTYGKMLVGAILNEYKNLHNLDVCGSQKATIMIELSELLILLNKSVVVKSMEGRAQMGFANAPISRKKK